MQTVFVRPERCIGCRQCEFACAVEHSHSRTPSGAAWEEPRPKPRIHVDPGPWLNSSFPSKCRHCDPAPCEAACLTGALQRDTEHDLVLIEESKCIACATCAMVCAFDAVTFHRHGNGHLPAVTAIKCDGCIDRLQHSRAPACVEACKTGALVFGEINDLIAADRERQSAASLRAVQPVSPDNVAAWRGWGRAATAVAEGVSHGNKSF